MDFLAPEQSGVLRNAGRQGFQEQRLQRTAQPFVSGDIESDFLAPDDGRRQFVLHQFLEDEFLLPAADFEMRRQCGGELHDAVVQKRRPHFQRMSHAHAVRFCEDIVRKIILLVEPEIVRQIIPWNGSPAHFREDETESAGKRCMKQVLFLCVGEGSVPMDVRAFRWHAAAFEETLHLVFEADFFVGHRPVAQSSGRELQSRGGQSPQGAGQAVGPVGDVPAEEFVGAFAAEGHGDIFLAQLG